MSTKTFTVRGHKIRTRTERRFVAVAVRAEDFVTETGTYVRFAEIEKRSDSADTARTHARRAAQRHGFPARGVAFVVVDTVTGEEV